MANRRREGSLVGTRLNGGKLIIGSVDEPSPPREETTGTVSTEWRERPGGSGEGRVGWQRIDCPDAS